MSALRQLRREQLPQMTVAQLAASVAWPKALIDAEVKLGVLRERHASIDFQLNTFLQIEDPNQRRSHREDLKQLRAEKSEIEGKIADARKQHSKSRELYVRAVEKALAARRSEAIAAVATHWESFCEGWNTLDEVEHALSHAGKFVRERRTTIAQIKVLVGRLVNRTLEAHI